MSEPLTGGPERAPDDTDEGWGERSEEGDPDDLDRFERERPPHHGE